MTVFMMAKTMALEGCCCRFFSNLLFSRPFQFLSPWQQGQQYKCHLLPLTNRRLFV